MAETARVTCPPGVFTALSNAGQTNVTFQSPNIFGGFMIIATSQPAADATNYSAVRREAIKLGSLGASDRVWWRPDSPLSQEIEVLRG